MIVKLTKYEQKTLKALDPKGKGARPWQTAREVSGGVYRKKAENIHQNEIRMVRNSFRKIVREGLVEVNPSERGQYRISDKGRKLAASGTFEFTGKFDRGEATKKPSKKATKKVAKKAAKKATKKATKKAAKKVAKKVAKKAAKKKVAKKAAKIEVVDKTKNGTKSSAGNGEKKKKPVFKRRKALQYADRKSE